MGKCESGGRHTSRFSKSLHWLQSLEPILVQVMGHGAGPEAGGRAEGSGSGWREQVPEGMLFPLSRVNVREKDTHGVGP